MSYDRCLSSSRCRATSMLRLTVWPGARETVLAEAQAHGSRVTWRDG